LRLRDLGERELIRAIRKDFAKPGKGLILGIGDDAAVIEGGKRRLILTTDVLIEGSHFLRALQPAFWLGRKSLNVNLSDIAAMGGTPRYVLLGLGLPQTVDTRWVSDFFSGFKSAATESGALLIGGDLSQAAEVFISVTAIGEGRAIIRRNGGRPGDLIFASGFLGDAAGGLRLLRRGFRLGRDKKADHLLKAFLDPVPQVRLGRRLASRGLASSMIDSSDGLSVDLLHLCEESGLGAELELDRLPISPQLRNFEKDPSALALHGGEDYQLVFTVAPGKYQAALALRRHFMITPIGRMTKARRLCIIDRRGKKKPLPIKGYEHFIKQRKESGKG